MQPTLVVLAAGMGSRYGGLKQVDPMGPSGETIIDYSVYDAHRAGFGKVVFVIRRDIEADFRQLFFDKIAARVPAELAFQEMDISQYADGEFHREKPWGTTHAVLAAHAQVQEPFAVINADDYYGREPYELLAKFLTQNTSPDRHTMIGYMLNKTLSDHGTVNRGVGEVDSDDRLTQVAERKKIARDGSGTIYYNAPDEAARRPLGEDTVVSMNMFGFMPSIFDQMAAHFRQFAEKTRQDPTAELTIPDVLNELIRRGETQVQVLRTQAEWFGVTYREDKPIVMEKIQRLIADGVYPENLWGS